MSYQQQQQDDAHVAFVNELSNAGDVASQGETTSVDTPEGRLDDLGVEHDCRGRDRDYFDLRHILASCYYIYQN